MSRNPALYPYNWAWFLAGLMLFGVTAELIFGSGARYFWGALGGTLLMIIGGLRAARRKDSSATSNKASDRRDSDHKDAS